MNRLRVRAGTRELEADIPAGAQNILQAVYLSGLFEPPPLCAGLALCGRCRVRFLPGPAGEPSAALAPSALPPPLPEDVKALGQRAVEQGWRLGCRHKPVPGAWIELPPGVRALERPEADAPEAEGTGGHDGACAAHQALAVDFGSTSLHSLVVVEPGTDAGAEQNAPPVKIMVNPQMGAGSDIISRLAFARRAGGAARLAALSRAALKRLAAEAGGAREICLAANPAMTCLLLEKDISGLAAAPYHLDYKGGRRENPPGLPPLWVAPLMGPFMGGDLSAGYAALAWERKAAYPFLLADLGTNGEFILALSENEALAASLPLGPALEGMGMSCGSEARPGVITAFALTSDGLVPQMYGQSSPTRGLAAPPTGLSGTAYISLARHLLRQGLLLPGGMFAEAPPASPSPPPSPPPSPLAARLFKALRAGPSGRAFYLMENLYMTGADVEELLKIKAAFTLALKLLLQEAGLGFSALKQLYLAGAFGSYINISALEDLGFIPPGGSARTSSAGNTSLAGAALMCKRPELREPLADWAAKVRVLGLAERPDFQNQYAAEMQFAWRQ